MSQEIVYFIGLLQLPNNNDNIVNIEWEGLEEFAELLDELEDEFFKIAKEEYTKYGMLLEEGAKSLAPHDEGDLEDSINFQQAKREGNSITLEGGSNLKYAMLRHEAPQRSGKHDKYDNGSKFPDYYHNSRGQRTRTKGAWRGYKAGRKFLKNAILATEQDFDKMNKRIMTRVFKDGDES